VDAPVSLHLGMDRACAFRRGKIVDMPLEHAFSAGNANFGMASICLSPVILPLHSGQSDCEGRSCPPMPSEEAQKGKRTEPCNDRYDRFSVSLAQPAQGSILGLY